MSRTLSSRPVAAGVVGCLAFLLIGWSGLVVPSLIRSVKDAYDQSDAGIGLYYLVYAIFYATGSFAGGLATERLGRRTVLVAGAVLLGVGVVTLGIAPTWAVFLVAAVPAGLGSGTIDGGANGLILDLYVEGRGRALNLLHLFFSLGALTAPVTIGLLVENGIGHEAIIIGTGLAAFPVAALFALVAMPGGRRDRADAEASGAGRIALQVPLIILGLAIGLYVASEVGVSSWLVRFLEPAPLTTATTALSLYWGGLAVGRLLSSALADRFDHRRFATACAVAMAVALVGAIFIPSLPVSIAFFALAGIASGPIYPMIIAIGGDRYPGRSAAVSGFLGGTAVVGSIVYPPVMGLLSVTVGLVVAMAGNIVLAIACAVALVLVRGVRSAPAGG
ncbi:MAG TPA: MFS transporter [Candidatus Limnocylindrales bacterium]|nr:MFS transporter [Candidatus Limnocylindrales bacterium]